MVWREWQFTSVVCVLQWAWTDQCGFHCHPANTFSPANIRSPGRTHQHIHSHAHDQHLASTQWRVTARSKAQKLSSLKPQLRWLQRGSFPMILSVYSCPWSFATWVTVIAPTHFCFNEEMEKQGDRSTTVSQRSVSVTWSHSRWLAADGGGDGGEGMLVLLALSWVEGFLCLGHGTHITAAH